METRTVTIGEESPDDERIREAGAALARGELIVFPTETVYGLGTSADSRVDNEALNRLKNRKPDKPFTLHQHDP